MQLVKGRNFSREFGTDSSAMIINETTAKLFGFQDPIGKKIYSFDDNNKPVAHTVIGVIKNFHFQSLRQSIGPLCMVLENNPDLTSFKVNTADIQGLVQKIESKWKSMAPGMPFSYRFMDESFDDMYRAEQRVGKVAITFALLTIIIACLGLFGLVTYAAEQRIKEIGIRKVLGASVRGIVQLLSKDFIRLVLIAFVIAAPIAWYIMYKWLEDFNYRIHINGWAFILSGCVALLIALVTVSYQAIRAALSNPVKNLRTE